MSKIDEILTLPTPDKNGVLVYEGDFIRWPHLKDGCIHEVYFNKEENQPFARPVNGHCDASGMESFLDNTHMEKVITGSEQQLRKELEMAESLLSEFDWEWHGKRFFSANIGRATDEEKEYLIKLNQSTGR